MRWCRKGCRSATRATEAAVPDQQQPPGYLGSSYPVPTDPNYYLSQTGLSSLLPQAFNQQTLAGMFAPQSMQYTPANTMATNPFLQLFMNASEQGTRLQRKLGPEDVPGGAVQPAMGY